MVKENNEGYCDRRSVEELIENIPSEKTLEKNATILKSLADPTRLKIIYLLKNRKLCACEILDTIDKSQSTISHHLNMMKREGILLGRKEGTWIYYKLANDQILNVLDNFFSLIE